MNNEPRKNDLALLLAQAQPGPTSANQVVEVLSNPFYAKKGQCLGLGRLHGESGEAMVQIDGYYSQYRHEASDTCYWVMTQRLLKINPDADSQEQALSAAKPVQAAS